MDPFVADVNALFLFELFRDLLRAQVLTDQGFNQSPGRKRNARFRLVTSLQSHVMSLFRTVTAKATVASEFSADNGLMDTNHLC
jgi:hypothetical protein